MPSGPIRRRAPTLTWLTGRRKETTQAFSSINNDGVLTFNEAPDYEAATDSGADNVYEVTVNAAAGGEMAMMAVTVTVTNVDEDGTVSLTTTRPVLGTAITASVSDLDGVDVDSVTWQWASSSDGMGSWTNITGATEASYTPVITDDGKYLQATASYTDGHGSGKTEEAATDGAVSGRIAPLSSLPQRTEPGAWLRTRPRARTSAPRSRPRTPTPATP